MLPANIRVQKQLFLMMLACAVGQVALIVMALDDSKRNFPNREHLGGRDRLTLL